MRSMMRNDTGLAHLRAELRFLVGILGHPVAVTRRAGGITSYTRIVKIAISLPDDLHERADAAASRLGVNRSQLYARAIEEFLDAEGDDPVTAALDRLADELGPAAAPGAGRRLIDSGGWEW